MRGNEQGSVLKMTKHQADTSTKHHFRYSPLHDTPHTMTLCSAEADLVCLISDVIASLGGTFRHAPRLYRDLKVSLAILSLEIYNTDILLTFSENSKLWRSFEGMAKAFEHAFRRDIVSEKHRQLKTEDEKQAPPASRWWPRFFTIWIDTPQVDVNEGKTTPYPCLEMVRDLLQSSVQRDLRIGDLLSDDRGVIQDLTKLVNYLVDDLDSGHSPEDEEDMDEKATPSPLISKAAICGDTSIRNLSQTLYHTLHENWPCRLEGHEHGGKLGHCVEAKFCLDPQWMARDSDLSHDSFFVLLAGSDVIQECRIGWSASR